MIAIFDTLAAADAYCAEIDAALGYPCAGVPEQPYPLGWTLTWGTPRPHPVSSLWMVKVPPKFSPPETASETVEKLDASWSPAVMP